MTQIVALTGAGPVSGDAFAEALHLPDFADSVGYSFVAPDPPPLGSWLGPGWAHSREQDEAILALVTDGPAKLIGYSNGGFLALRLALLYPHAFDAAVLLGSGLLGRDAHLAHQPLEARLLFVHGASDDSVRPAGNVTPIGRTQVVESFLGPRHAAEALTGVVTPIRERKIDLVEPRGFVAEWVHGPRFRGAETTESVYDERVTRCEIANAEHFDYLGPAACRDFVRWLVHGEELPAD